MDSVTHAPRNAKTHLVTFSFQSRGANRVLVTRRIPMDVIQQSQPRLCHTLNAFVPDPADPTALIPSVNITFIPPYSSSSVLIMFFPNLTIPVHIDVTISSQKPWTVHKDLSSVKPIHVPFHTYWSESMEPRGSSARATSA